MILTPHISLAVPAHAQGIAEMSREYIEYGLGWSWTQARVLKAHLALLAVELDHRKRGLGALLLAWLEKCAVTAGLELVQVEARADNQPALEFYQGQGYRQQGTVPGYYCGIVDA